jgi:aspartate kinase
VELLEKVKHDHYQILKELFHESDHPVFDELNNTFVEIEWILEDAPAESDCSFHRPCIFES